MTHDKTTENVYIYIYLAFIELFMSDLHLVYSLYESQKNEQYEENPDTIDI